MASFKSPAKPWLLLGLLFLLVIILSTTISQANEQPPQPLFLRSNEAPLIAPDATEARYRPVTINTAILGGADGNPDLAARTIRLNLFDDVIYTAVQERVQRNNSGSFSWIGYLDGVPLSRVSLVLKAGVLTGIVASPEGIFELRYHAGLTHLIYEINQAAFPDEHIEDAHVPDELLFEPAPPTSVTPTDDGSIIDIMVFYTPNARTGAGGTTAIENTIDMAVDWTNISYTDSQINHQLNLVYKAEVTYTDSGNLTTDRNRLRTPGDGYMDEVHALRDTYRADVVSLIVESPGCGISYIMSPVSPTFESYAFNVTMRTCAVSNYTFGHEIGHNMSARHDWIADPTNNSPFTYNHGYIAPGNLWRTVMSYGSSCGNCPRLGYWSNPNVLYNGLPMGIPEGQANAAHNALVHNNTAYTVANFRQSLSGGTPTPTPTSSPTPTPTPTPTPPANSGNIFLPHVVK